MSEQYPNSPPEVEPSSEEQNDNGENQSKELYPTDENTEIIEQKSSSDDGGNKPPEQENHEAHNSRWLDPRFILELKEKYDRALAEHDSIRASLHDTTSEHYKNILKTQVIGRAIKDKIKRSEWLSGEGNLGPLRLERYFNPTKKYIYEAPSEDLVEHIATLIDEPYESLKAKAEEADQKFAEKHHTFNPGENVVQVMSDKSSVDEGWVVDKITYEQGEEWVWISKGMESKHQLASYLKAQQEAVPISDEDKLKKLVKEMRPYFGGTAKIRVDEDHIMKGRFAGLTTQGKVYLQYDVGVLDENDELKRNEKGEPILETVQIKVDPETFFEWQQLKTNEEKAEDLHKQKIDRINAEIPDADRLFELGQEVKFASNSSVVVEDDWTVNDIYINADKNNAIWVKLLKGNDLISIDQKLLAELQNVEAGAPVDDFQAKINEVTQIDKSSENKTDQAAADVDDETDKKEKEIDKDKEIVGEKDKGPRSWKDRFDNWFYKKDYKFRAPARIAGFLVLSATLPVTLPAWAAYRGQHRYIKSKREKLANK
jgi:hypothetical protein